MNPQIITRKGDRGPDTKGEIIMASIRKREGKDGVKYQIRSSCGYDIFGQQVVRSMTWKPSPGMTQRQIEKELNRQAILFDEKCAGQVLESGNIKFETFARQWMEEYAGQKLRPKTIGRLHQLEPRIYSAIGNVRLDQLTARRIQSFIWDLSKNGVNQADDRAAAKVSLPELLKERGITQKQLGDIAGLSYSTVSSACRGTSVRPETAKKIAEAFGMKTKDLFVILESDKRLSKKTIQHYLSFISSVMDYAFRFSMIPENPCKRVILPEGKGKQKQKCYTLKETQKFLDSLETAPIKYKAFFVLAIYGGFRRSEILGLEWKDIDFTERTISIQRTSQYMKGKGVFTDTTKTEESQRTLKLPKDVFDVLRELRVEQAQVRLFMGDRWDDHDRLFTKENGRPMHPNTPYHWQKRFCEETGQRFLGVHAFRHLNASLLINAGVDVKTVSTTLGHSQVTTTLNIYAHTFKEAQARASEAVSEALTQSIGKSG